MKPRSCCASQRVAGEAARRTPVAAADPGGTGKLAKNRSQWDEAQDLLEGLLPEFGGKADFLQQIADIRNILGIVYARKGEYESAQSNFNEALRFAASCTGNPPLGTRRVTTSPR
ncbi:MAG: tetratricopeptide repeat protein [Planctomycetota bacterium]